MILCLIGTNPYSFERLVKQVDTKLGRKYEVVIQKGNTIYTPMFSKSFDFCDNKTIQNYINQSDLIISQGGYGSMMEAIQKGKKVIAVPRKINLNESLDDQIELVKYFEEKKYVLGCYDIQTLESLVVKCLNEEFIPNSFEPESKKSISIIIENYLNQL